MIEETIQNYLRENAFPCYLSVPEKPSGNFWSHRVVQTMLDADTLPEIVSCTLNTDYNFPDTTRKLPRYQAVFEVVHY